MVSTTFAIGRRWTSSSSRHVRRRSVTARSDESPPRDRRSCPRRAPAGRRGVRARLRRRPPRARGPRRGPREPIRPPQDPPPGCGRGRLLDHPDLGSGVSCSRASIRDSPSTGVASSPLRNAVVVPPCRAPEVSSASAWARSTMPMKSLELGEVARPNRWRIPVDGGSPPRRGPTRRRRSGVDHRPVRVDALAGAPSARILPP